MTRAITDATTETKGLMCDGSVARAEVRVPNRASYRWGGLPVIVGAGAWCGSCSYRIVNRERVTQALREARVVLEGLRGEEAEAVARLLHAIADAEHALRRSSPALSVPEQAHADMERQMYELKRELAAQDEFASALAHELRNLLAPIVMQAEYLLDAARQAGSGVLSVEWLSLRLASLCDRLRKFVAAFNRVMDASRVTSGRVHLELENVDLSAVVREVCAGFEREAATARSTLTLDVPSQVLGCWDPLRLEQVCTNLVSNAIRYGAGRPIEVSVRGEEEWAELRVRDHGIGIAEADQQRVFERFERAAQQRNTGGFGIGLWIVREICRALEGSIELQSTLGQGSIFIVRLPRWRRQQRD
jgi:signal transduction histidine kinase